ncbi:aminopeptidase P family protein [Pseudoalteromonas rubra]|uniref:Aminopeptidase P family protein n=1 Tax=Pseudoalteromonas rubra TaxID=43658 RepID=A0A5S3WJK1_9GAMM|nr:Xaa-Pro peptidase family protein [Pseudoalteromonas rubra]TMP26963.1 aminopeptidase P family protein [Pseudoalteromonas rubra]TMP27681.1 aminopeptidase P family protein [Pseudoalteromonas rubra]
MSQYLQRQTRMRSQLLTSDYEGMLVFGYENIRYLCGFSGHAATLLISHEQCLLITDYRYFERASKEAEQTEVVLRHRDTESLGQCLNRLSGQLKVLAFDAAHIDVGQWQQISGELSGRVLMPTPGLVEQLRQVKTTHEVNRIRQAAQIADQALADTLPLIKEGVSERELALELDYRMQKLGSEGVSFDTILLFGARSALPHGNPSTQQLRHGDLILIDFGAVVDGYRSDMTRTYVYGTPSTKQRAMFDTVQTAQQAALARACSGADCQVLNEAAHAVLLNSEFAQYAGEGLGHGLGLFLHEQPFIKPGVNYQLEPGNVITIEPGIYIPGYGGVRLEEDIALTESGYELLTHSPQHFEL